MSICKEKPDMLPPLDAIGLEPADQNHNMYRGGSSKGRAASAMQPPGMVRQASVGLGIGGFSKSGSGFAMGNFATPGSKLSSQERFEQARSVSANARFSGAPQITRTPSQSGSGRTRSKKGSRRPGADEKLSTPTSAFGPGIPAIGPNGQPLEPVAPLEKSENAWKAMSATRRPVQQNTDSPDVVDRKVKALLNKLTMEKFDSISDQIIEWANKSEKEKDGRTLIQVIRLVFEKATDEAAWSEMYARLCRKMMERISPKVQDESIRSDDKPIAGGQLFRKYLLNRCQEDFERGWAAKDAAAAAAAAKAGDDEAAKAQAEAAADGEAALYSEEYYAAQKAKRQGLGLVKFIGELFKLQMLTERIMHECVKKLLANVDNPEEEEIESLCKLLTTVGKLLDSPKARSHMDIYFSRMKELAKNPKVNSRMQFMLQVMLSCCPVGGVNG
jgi:translation initiation factor 4G